MKEHATSNKLKSRKTNEELCCYILEIGRNTSALHYYQNKNNF